MSGSSVPCIWRCTGRSGAAPKKNKYYGEGTIKDLDGYTPHEDSKDLTDILKSSESDREKQDKIINIVALRSNKLRQVLAASFEETTGEPLTAAIVSELGNSFKYVINALFTKAEEFGAQCIYEALNPKDGKSADTDALVEILCASDNYQIKEISAHYKAKYKCDLGRSLQQSDASDSLKKLLFFLAQGTRPEGSGNKGRATKDAQSLVKVSEKPVDQVESQFYTVLGTRSYGDLNLIFKEYQKLSKKSIDEAIKDRISGDLQRALLSIVKCSKDFVGFLAESIHDAMESDATTDEKALVRLIVSRSELDMVQVKLSFEAKYAKSLETYVEGDYKRRSGDHKKVLLQLVQGN